MFCIRTYTKERIPDVLAFERELCVIGRTDSLTL